MIENFDEDVIGHFGQEWRAFGNLDRGWDSTNPLEETFEAYFRPLPAGSLESASLVGDFGAGNGRWATFVAPRVRHLYVVEPSEEAVKAARLNLAGASNVTFIQRPIGDPLIPTGTFDVVYAVGVIHYVPDPLRALRDIRKALRPTGVFLGYLYYALENRPVGYRLLWRMSDLLRRGISKLSPRLRRIVADGLALLVYWPLARSARSLHRHGLAISWLPLHSYADKSFYLMRKDSFNRFGAPLEHRFTRQQIESLLECAGFDVSTLVFSPSEPYWCFSVRNDASNAASPLGST